MRKVLLFLMVMGVSGLAGLNVVAQFRTSTVASSIQRCDRSRLSPIRCGYYDEGYQDGVNDARSGRSADHDRYDSKFERKYESYYRDGYNAGYRSIRSNARWNSSQRQAYDLGHRFGDDDRRRSISRLPARYEGRYNRNFEAYYRKGYNDGYFNRRKQYDTAINSNNSNNNRRGNRRGTTTGTINWNGRVDNRANIIIQNGRVRTETVAGRSVVGSQTIQGVLPRRGGNLSVRKQDGRGNAFVLQQPTRANNFTGIVQVFDSRGGSDNYRLQISWRSSNLQNVQEQYQSGKVIWRGRVDATAHIKISGDFVESIDVTGSGLSNVTFDLEGYLAGRRGTVTVRKKDGRGNVTILEQPNASNDYTATIQIFDGGGGDDQYELEISW